MAVEFHTVAVWITTPCSFVWVPEMSWNMQFPPPFCT